MDQATCKFYNGDYHNKRCEAGVDYRSVTAEPDRNEGSAFRKPCIDWEAWNKAHGREGFDNAGQAEEWGKRGHCDKRQEPTKEEVDEWEAESKRRSDEIVASLEQGVIPPGVMVCGPGTFGKCKCNCPESCEHVWDGRAVEEDGMSTATCSRCGKWAINHDMWV